MIEAALVQLDTTREPRLERALEALAECKGAGLVLLPELWNVDYLEFERYREGGEPLEGPTLAAVAAKARELKAHILAGSILEQAGERLYNTSVLFGPRGEIVASYRKIHLFGYRSKEKELLAAGEELVVARTELGPLGLSLCYDLRFPELYRAQLDLGALAFLIPAAWPAARIEHWRLLARARALENQSFLLGCNAAGPRYGGHSLAVSPQGEILGEATEAEEILWIRLDFGEVERVRAELPFLEDRVRSPWRA
ncbi:MAG: carbon-nitrogen family hydrolase [Candidatus Acetothermia bacterium]|jgi:predicted amidohydrolase|nr:carbon-nitrogen family hydrolase [Candidatus Acetothermia bacterium]MDH7506057.1 nitrilase-related carbon-nitrogen hydrolase [Candidatus Acetothermia bacterium]